MAILKTPGLSPAERAKLLELATADTTKFYSLLNYIAGMMIIPIASIGWALGDWIRKH